MSQKEAQALIRRQESDVRAGYFTHLEADWRDVLRSANEIGIASAYSVPCRAPDLLHVAYAVELGTELFISFDEDQIELAKAAGLKAFTPE